jgi:hypothetical protein
MSKKSNYGNNKRMPEMICPRQKALRQTKWARWAPSHNQAARVKTKVAQPDTEIAFEFTSECIDAKRLAT